MSIKPTRDEINKAHERLEALEQQGRFEDANDYYQKNSWIFDFDRTGNWVGSVANENGWTP
jgi:hypothetical protein